MKTILFAAAVLGSTAAIAQTSMPPAVSGVATFPAIIAPSEPSAVFTHDASPTPAMERYQLQRAIALREEANRLRIADGGTLSRANLRYIQRKVDAILAGR